MYVVLLSLLFSVSLLAQALPRGDTSLSSTGPKIKYGPSITLVFGRETTANLPFDLAGILARTNEMRECCRRRSSADRLLQVGDTGQHQGGAADRLFQRLQEAGRRTAKLQLIVRRKNPARKRSVEMLRHGQVMGAIEGLEKRAGVGQIVDPQERTQIIARQFPGCQDAGCGSSTRLRPSSTVM
jgi:hypothetical protein